MKHEHYENARKQILKYYSAVAVTGIFDFCDQLTQELLDDCQTEIDRLESLNRLKNNAVRSLSVGFRVVSILSPLLLLGLMYLLWTAEVNAWFWAICLCATWIGFTGIIGYAMHEHVYSEHVTAFCIMLASCVGIWVTWNHTEKMIEARLLLIAVMGVTWCVALMYSHDTYENAASTLMWLFAPVVMWGIYGVWNTDDISLWVSIPITTVLALTLLMFMGLEEELPNSNAELADILDDDEEL